MSILSEFKQFAIKGNVIDLMEALRASIDVRGSRPAQTKDRKAPKRAAASSTRKAARR